MEIDIDLETFSEVNLKDVGLDNYAKHHSTKILCMAYRVQGEKEVNLFAWDSILPPAFSENYTIVAHNAAFEMAILKNQNRIPHPSGAICTAAMAAAMSLIVVMWLSSDLIKIFRTCPLSRSRAAYSTVTDLARLRGWSTSVPFVVAVK